MRSAALLLMLLPVLPAAAQEPLETKLVVTQGGQEIGREEFTLRSTRGRGLPGTHDHRRRPVSGHRSHDPSGRHARAHAGCALAKFQLDVESAGAVTVILAAGSGARLIVRTVAKGSESGRELPGGPDVVLLDDAVFSLYHPVAELATPAGRTLTAIFPRSGKRATFTARRESGAAGGASRCDLERRHRRHAGDRRAAAGSSGWSSRPKGTVVTRARVATLLKSLPRQRRSLLRRNLKPPRRGSRIRARPRPHPKGLSSMNRWFGFLALVALFPGLAAAQDSTAAGRHRPAPGRVTLSLQEALDQARANSPTYRQTLNDAGPARWGVRNAYGSLLPSVSVGSDLGYTGAGQSNIGGGFVQPTSAFFTSGYNLSLQWQLERPDAHRPGASRRRCSAPPTRTSAAPASRCGRRSRPST